jgi:hypothetical protein
MYLKAFFMGRTTWTVHWRTGYTLQENKQMQEQVRHLEEPELRGLSPRANYTDRATAACQQS